MQAAIASLLELSLEHVPDFKSHESKWFEVMYKFISVGGYDFDGTLYNPKYLMFSSPDFYKDREAPESMLEEIKDMTGVKGYFFATVYSPKFFNEDIKEFIGHAVVIDKNFNIVHDPNPEYKKNVVYPKTNEFGYNGILNIYMINERNIN